MAETTATLTVALSTKSLHLSAQIALYETITLTLAGYGSFGYADLEISLFDPADGTLLAQITAGSLSSAYAGTLSLNTAEMEAFFSGAEHLAVKKVTCTVWDATNDDLLASGFLLVRNNPRTADVGSTSSVASRYVADLFVRDDGTGNYRQIMIINGGLIIGPEVPAP